MFFREKHDAEPPKDVVDDAPCLPDIWILSPAGRLETAVRKLLHQRFQWNAILKRDGREDADRIE